MTAEHQGAGTASQLINLVVDATGDDSWQVRHNSGIGSAAQPAGNVPLAGTGYVGFWLKTDDPGITVRIGIDDPVGANTTALERGAVKNVVADNQWHLYQWNFEDAAAWDAFAGGANGQIDAASGNVTIDSIWLAGDGSSQIYLDSVMHNANGLITPGYTPGDFDGDGLVNSADYATWRGTFGQSVTPWTGADGNGNGVVDMGDYILWRRQMSAGSGASLAQARRSRNRPAYFSSPLRSAFSSAAESCDWDSPTDNEPHVARRLPIVRRKEAAPVSRRGHENRNRRIGARFQPSRRRTAATRPISPNPAKTNVAGSGTICRPSRYRNSRRRRRSSHRMVRQVEGCCRFFPLPR